MKKHLPFICVFYLCLVLCVLLYFVYTDSGKTIERANARIENELSDAYNKGWANGYAFSAKEYEEAAASVQPLEVSEIPGYSMYKLPRAPRIDNSPCDELGRPGPAYALLEPVLLPESASSSLSVTPIGYKAVQFGFISSGGWLYNRTHLIGSLFGGESSKENIITCTQYLNQVLMYPLEAKVYSYLAAGLGRVQMAVIPAYQENELLPRGLYFFAQSVSDESIRISVFLPNIQPGVSINYLNGDAEETLHF